MAIAGIILRHEYASSEDEGLAFVASAENVVGEVGGGDLEFGDAGWKSQRI